MTNVLERVHNEATRTSVTDISAHLQQLLGQRTTAFACGVRSPKSVGHWVAGTQPAADTTQRLRALFETVLILEDEDDETKVAWLTGTNPGLDGSRLPSKRSVQATGPP